MNEPTPLQRRILDYLAECIEERGLPPTLREIGAKCGITSTGSVSYHLRLLESQGLLKRHERSSRSTLPLESPGRLPILGRVGAGGAVLAQEDIEGDLAVGKDIARGADYLLRVRGESMRDAGIFEGDLVQVRKQDDGREGEVVVAVVGEAAVVKKLRKRSGGGWQLDSANPDFAPITEEFKVIGKVVGLLRRY